LWPCLIPGHSRRLGATVATDLSSRSCD